MKMRGKPSLEEFRNGGADVSESGAAASPVAAATRPVPASATEVVPAVAAPAARINKTIRIRKAHDSKLKELAYKNSSAEGRKVSESDLIEQALDEFFTRLDSAST